VYFFCLIGTETYPQRRQHPPWFLLAICGL
jgi:hypothetical protein